jgi:lipoprotein-anchoring transpeptidase ErfK/SrfK
MANAPALGVRGFAVTAAGSLLVIAAFLAPASSAHTDLARVPQARVVGAGVLTQPTTAVLAKPQAGSRRVAVMEQFRPDFRPQYVLASATVEAKKSGKPAWYRISVPGRPNGKTGWVRAAAVELRPVTKRLVIYRGARRFEFWHGRRLVRAGRVAVGKPGLETPLGLFYVTWKFNPAIDPNWSALGAYAFETSAYSPTLTDWPGGGIVGVHGTTSPGLIGQAVSHGCVRMHNRDVLFLKPRIALGTPIKIVP